MIKFLKKEWEVFLILAVMLICLFVMDTRASTLSDIADSLQPGEWGELQTTGWGPSLYDDGGYPAVAWINTAGYYNGRILINCRAHNSSTPHLYVYDELTNSWSEGTSPGSRAHGYDHNTIDPNTGDFYTNRGTQIFSVLRTGETTWVDLPTAPSSPYFSNAMAIAYHPVWQTFLYGSRGRMNGYNGTSWGAVVYSGLPYAEEHQVAEFNPIDSNLYIGGGNGNRVVARVFLDSTFENLSPAPGDVGPDMGNLVFGPSTGIGYLIDNDGGIHCLLLGDTAWTEDCDIVPWGVSNNNPFVYGVTAIPIPDYGAIMYATLSEIWVYKDGQPDTTTVPPDTTSPPPDTLCVQDTLFLNDTLVFLDTLFQVDTLIQTDSVPYPEPYPVFTWPDSIWMDTTLYLKQ